MHRWATKELIRYLHIVKLDLSIITARLYFIITPTIIFNNFTNCCDFLGCLDNCCFICHCFSHIASSFASIRNASSTTSGGNSFHSLCGNGLGYVLNMIKFIKIYNLQSWQYAQRVHTDYTGDLWIGNKQWKKQSSSIGTI